MAAIAVYMGTHPFQLFDESYMKDFIFTVSNGVYLPPSAHLISGNLLEEICNIEE